MVNTAHDKPIILIIDDTPSNITLMSGILNNTYKVKAATNGKKGLEVAATSPLPDLILLDIMMPEMDGYQVCDALKKSSASSDIPVIFLTAKNESEDEEKGLKMGAVDYITKPVSPPIALSRIASHVELFRQKKALIESQRALSDEINEAASYIQSLLPQKLDQDTIKSSWQHIPCSALGGDAFGHHWLDDDHMAIFLIDVCGHGVGAAMLCISAINSLRSESLANTDFKSPASVLNGLNKAFPMEAQNLKYFTMWYGVYSQSTKSLKFASAGHPHAILLKKESDKDDVSLNKLETKGIAIGCFEEAEYREEQVYLASSNKLYVFSDGVYEITDKNDHEMTLENFSDLVEKKFCDDNKLQSADIYAEINHMQKVAGPLNDDFSILELIFKHN